MILDDYIYSLREELCWNISYGLSGIWNRGGKNILYMVVITTVVKGQTAIFLFFLVENDNYLIFLCILFPYQIFCLGFQYGYPPESPAALYSGGTHPVKCDKNATP
jgi:hypothetical protein